MSYIVRLYTDDKIIEKEINEQGTYLLGSEERADVRVDVSLLEKQEHLITIDSVGWYIREKSSSNMGEAKKRISYMKFDDTVMINPKKRGAITVYRYSDDNSLEINIGSFEKLVIGRKSDCDVVVDSRQVSSEHITISRREEKIFFKDLNSLNGTYFNGKRKREGELKLNDVICIGHCRIIRDTNNLHIIFAGKIVSNINKSRHMRPVQNARESYPFLFSQSPRLMEDIPTDLVDMERVPSLGSKPSIGWLNILIQPILTVGVMLGIVYFMKGMMTMIYFSLPMTIIGIIMSFARYKSEKKKYKKNEMLRLQKYQAYLDEKRDFIVECQKKHRDILNQQYPSVATCMSKVENVDRTIWDRKVSDIDFMRLRVGKGEIDTLLTIKVPNKTFSLEEDSLLESPAKLMKEYEKVKDCPITLDLGTKTTLGIIGDRPSVVNLAKNLVVQACTYHSVNDMKLVVLCDRSERALWQFVRWLPHSYDEARSRRYFADTKKGADSLLDDIEETLECRYEQLEKNNSSSRRTTHAPHYMIVCASQTMISGHSIFKYLQTDESIGVSVVFLCGGMNELPKDCFYIVDAQNNSGVVYQRERSQAKQLFEIERVRTSLYEKFARNMAPLRMMSLNSNASIPLSISFLQGYHAKKPNLIDIKTNWRESRPENEMSVPLGIKSDGEYFYFDIHDKKFGPHGLVAGMTGSGKSEMMQSWILSMALKFSPSSVAFVLIDFKGTGLLLPFKKLPHLAGSISDLDFNIGRNLIALENELMRRKDILDRSGVSNISSYLNLVREGKADEEMPYLFVIIDEFAEFKLKFPDFMTVVNKIFRTGRTLGVHTILLTQKPGNVVSDEMMANTRFRWCLKVASSNDSRDMLRRIDAAKITNPGRAFVQVGEDEVFEEIQSFWSGAPYNPYRSLDIQRSDKISVIDMYGNRTCYEAEKITGYRSVKNEIDAIVEYIDDVCTEEKIKRAKAIWMSKLPDKLNLREVLNVVFDGEKWSDVQENLKVSIGLIDDPSTQSQYPLDLNFSKGGHVAVYGAPGVGKTTLLQTSIMSMALAYAPDMLNLYVIDFGGGNLNLFKDLPHVGGFCTGDDSSVYLEKMVNMVTDELEARRKIIADFGGGNIEDYKESTGKRLPYIVLIVDNFMQVMEMHPEADGFFQNFVRYGGNYGMYLMVVGGAPNTLPYRLTQNIKNNVVMRLADNNDYALLLGRTNGLYPEDYPGRGMMKQDNVLEFQIALPYDGDTNAERIKNIKKIVELMNEKWHGSRPKSLPIMPSVVKETDYQCNEMVAGLYLSDVSTCKVDMSKQHLFLISELKTSGTVLGNFKKQILQKYDVKKHIDFSAWDTESQQSFDGEINDIMPELEARRKAYIGNETSIDGLPYILISIDGLRQWFDISRDDTVKRLNSIAIMGQGLRCILLVSDSGDSIKSMYHKGEQLTLNLVRGADIFTVGGSMNDYEIFKTDLSYEQQHVAVGDKEGYYICDEKAYAIRFFD